MSLFACVYCRQRGVRRTFHDQPSLNKHISLKKECCDAQATLLNRLLEDKNTPENGNASESAQTSEDVEMTNLAGSLDIPRLVPILKPPAPKPGVMAELDGLSEPKEPPAQDVPIPGGRATGTVQYVCMEEGPEDNIIAAAGKQFGVDMTPFEDIQEAQAEAGDS